MTNGNGHKIHVAYGGPGERGVTTLLGIGSDELDAHADKTDKALSGAGWASLGLWFLGVAVNSRALRFAGLGGAAVAYGVKHLSSR